MLPDTDPSCPQSTAWKVSVPAVEVVAAVIVVGFVGIDHTKIRATTDFPFV